MGVFQFGHAGVDLFFVISGFIILFVHYDDIGNPKRLGRYVSRRFSRIMPIYWVALAVTIILGQVGGHHEFSSLLDVASSVALLPSHHGPLLGGAWTLQYEIVFYSVFCLLIFNRILGLSAFGVWLGGIIIIECDANIISDLPSSLFGLYNIEFFLGMAVAYWLRNHSVLIPRVVLAVGTGLFVAVSVAEDTGVINGYTEAGRFLYGPAAGLIVLGAAEASRQSLITVPKALEALGTASYSIYLFQFVFIGVLWKLWLLSGLGEAMPPAASFPLLAAAGVAGGFTMSRLVEYPLMQLVRLRRTPRAFPVSP